MVDTFRFSLKHLSRLKDELLSQIRRLTPVAKHLSLNFAQLPDVGRKIDASSTDNERVFKFREHYETPDARVRCCHKTAVITTAVRARDGRRSVTADPVCDDPLFLRA